MSRADPVCKLLTRMPGAGKAQPASAHSITELKVAKANIGERSKIREYLEIDFVPRVKETHVNLGSVQNKPITPFGRLTKVKEDNHPVIWQVFSPHQLVQDPHEEVRVQVLITEIPAGPLVSPDSEGLNDGREFPAGLGKVVLETSCLRERLALDDPDVGQSVEALAKQITRYARHASVDVGEPPGAGQQFPQNQGSPALGENFRSQRYGAELAIPFHAEEHDLFLSPPQVHFLNFMVQSCRRGKK